MLFNPLMRVLMFGVLLAATALIGIAGLVLLAPASLVSPNDPLTTVTMILCVLVAYVLLVSMG